MTPINHPRFVSQQLFELLRGGHVRTIPDQQPDIPFSSEQPLRNACEILQISGVQCTGGARGAILFRVGDQAKANDNSRVSFTGLTRYLSRRKAEQQIRIDTMIICTEYDPVEVLPARIVSV